MTENPLLCVTVTAPTMAELRARRDLIEDADLIELRLDTVSDPNPAGALQGRARPVIVTCRASWEGGSFRGTEEERHQMLRDALDAGAEYVDVEWRAGFSDLLRQTAGRRIVLSSHDFRQMPHDLPDMARAMRGTGAEVIKIAARASRLTDCLSLRAVAGDPGTAGRAVLIAMGEAGLATRVLAGRFGSAWTYAGSISDVGQLTAGALLHEYRFRGISPSTELYGLVGSPIGHSVSPAMHNAAFRAIGMDAVYLPLPAADADDFVTFANAMGIRGASVTIPYKVALFDRVDAVDEVARHIGALNTIRVDASGWFGRNTDAAGFLRPLVDAGMVLEGCRASILGAGGSARAVAVALASRGAVVRVHARDRARAHAVAGLASGQVGEWPPRSGEWDLLVNCTPVGMHPRVDETPVPAGALPGGVVYDLVYNPIETRLLREAAAGGCRTFGGLDMLVGQAQEQFEWWTGARPPGAVMRNAALARLAEFRTDDHHVV